MIKLRKNVLGMTAVCGCIYLYFALLLQLTCKNILCFQEGLCAYVNEGALLSSMIAEPGGLAKMCALWLTQWMVGPSHAVFVGASLYTAITMLATTLARRLGCSLWQLPLLAVPATALALMSCNIDYNLSGTTAYAFMLLCILPLAFIRNAIARLGVSIAGCLLAAWTGGAIVMLYALVVLNIEMLRCWRRGWMFLLLPALAYCIGLIDVEMGYFRDLDRALLPYSYYAHWASAASMSLLPWTMTIIMINASAVVGLIHKRNGHAYQAVFSVMILAVFAVIGARDNRNPEREAFARLSYLSGNRDWSQITKEYKQMPQENFTLQNIANMALAEKGELCDVMFQHYNLGVASLHNSQDKNPYAYMVLSDVYYSMGLIALSQRFAFEANEALGNYSPRMLKRLIDTNIITGQYEVARKYIALLESTNRYAEWARQRRLMTEGKAPLDSQLASKRACIFSDNRFAGERGIDDDLLQALRANHAHNPTIQYLCAYHMLGKNVPRLMGVIEEFHGTRALPSPLPNHLQEAVAVDAVVSGNGFSENCLIHPSVIERCKAFWAHNQSQPNSFWHYLRFARASQTEPSK